MLKHCTRCSADLPVERKSDWCAACWRESKRKRKARDPESFLALRRASDDRRREAIRAYERAYASANPEWNRGKRERQKAKNPVVLRLKVGRPDERERQRRYRESQPDKCRARQRRWRARNMEYDQARCRAWAKANPVQILAKTQRYQARKRGAAVGKVDIPALLAGWNGCCAICGKPVADGERHIDHILPVSLGGAHAQDNLQLTCRHCNLSKGNRVSREGGAAG